LSSCLASARTSLRERVETESVLGVDLMGAETGAAGNRILLTFGDEVVVVIGAEVGAVIIEEVEKRADSFAKLTIEAAAVAGDGRVGITVGSALTSSRNGPIVVLVESAGVAEGKRELGSV